MASSTVLSRAMPTPLPRLGLAGRTSKEEIPYLNVRNPYFNVSQPVPQRKEPVPQRNRIATILFAFNGIRNTTVVYMFSHVFRQTGIEMFLSCLPACVKIAVRSSHFA